jgi:hypothetical protein
MKTYYALCGGQTPLNRVVMAGSHDAGITGGKWYARTQKHDIKHQAKAGVRMFDLRIAAATGSGSTGGVKNAELRAYHADGASKSTETKTRFVQELGRSVALDRSSIRMGAFGETLGDMLGQAKAFVEKHTTEFLILKFDKCLNWELVAEACVTLLGNSIYKGGGNINKMTLDQLKGKVICAFTPTGLTAIGNNFTAADGIVGITNLNGGPPWRDAYDGIQYYGKGGTSLMGLRAKTENRKKQTKLMLAGINSHPEAMGMMYWTTTGLLGSIKARNDRMWKSSQRVSLVRTWNNGLRESIDNQLNGNIDPFDAGGALLKTFMPNFVMIDFADSDKCDLIMDLNTVGAQELARVAKHDVELEDSL